MFAIVYLRLSRVFAVLSLFVILPESLPEDVTSLALGVQFYVAPSGSPAGDGSRERPWDLPTALLQPSNVKPGATIWLRGGVYTGRFVSKLTGAPNGIITLRQYPGERAIIDSRDAFNVYGAWACYWGFEVMASDPKRITKQAGPWPTDVRRTTVNVFGSNLKFVNLIVHDAMIGFGFWKDAVNSEIYGCLIYNNGHQGPDRAWGQGIYTQNSAGIKRITDNIVFNNFAHGLQLYSSENADVKGYNIEGNVVFRNGSMGTTRAMSIVAESGRAIERVRLLNNYTYNDGGTNTLLGSYPNLKNKDLVIRSNYFVGGEPVLRLTSWSQVTLTGNIFYGKSGLAWLTAFEPSISQYTWGDNRYYLAGDGTQPAFKHGAESYQFTNWRQATGLDRDSRYRKGRPTGADVFVRPNRYEAGRAHIIVYNWNLNGAIDVNISGAGLAAGRRYEVRNAQDYFASPVASGVYDGKSLRLPMGGLSAAAPVGYSAKSPQTGPEFNVFVLVPQEAALGSPTSKMDR
jgi:parallel beta-helix repeat protein